MSFDPQEEELAKLIETSDVRGKLWQQGFNALSPGHKVTALAALLYYETYCVPQQVYDVPWSSLNEIGGGVDRGRDKATFRRAAWHSMLALGYTHEKLVDARFFEWKMASSIVSDSLEDRIGQMTDLIEAGWEYIGIGLRRRISLEVAGTHPT